MIRPRQHSARQSSSGFQLSLIVLMILLCCGLLNAQTTTRSITDAYTPVGLTPGTPAGAFALSGFDSITPFNGNLNFRLPLHKMTGRGSSGHTIFLAIDPRWRIETIQHQGLPPIYSPTINWWDAIKPGYGPGFLSGRQTGTPLWCGINYSNTFTTLTFTAPDGTELELRDQLNQGAPGNGQHACGGGPGILRGKVFVTTEGQAATFISDWDIYDAGGNEVVAQNGYELITPSGFLMLRDGTRYRIDIGRVTWVRDRNGNKVSFTYDVFNRVTTITDSVKRQVTIAYDVNDGFPYGVCDRITFKGSQGNTRIIRVSKTTLSNALRSGQFLQTYGGLFPDVTASGSTFNPSVISAAWLPDGRSYQFKYNSYAELARVILPTGGAYEYDWAAGATGGANSGTITQTVPTAIYRRVIERRVYADGSTLEAKITFSRPEFRISEGVYGTAGFVLVETFNAASVRQTATKQYFYGSSAASLLNSHSKWSTWKEGKEYQSEQLDTNGTTVLTRVVDTWQQRAWVPWALQNDNAPPVDPRRVETVTTVEPAGANLVSKRTALNPGTGVAAFDIYNNQTDLWEYHFGVGTPGGLIRRTHTDFVTTHPVTGADYACNPASTCGNTPNINNVIHLRDLRLQVQIFDAGGVEKARTTCEFDNYTPDSNHAFLVNRTSISGLDAGFTTGYGTRGNITGITHYFLNTSGTVTGSISSYQQYDIAGNMVKAIDARGHVTDYDFSDRFGAPDANAQANSGATELGAQVSFGFATKITNHLSHISYFQFDYYLSQPVDIEDPNGMVSSLYRADSIDRLTQVRRAVGAGAAHQTTFAYDDVNRIVTSTSDLHVLNDNIVTTKTLYDGLGRTTETRQYEGGTNYIATQTQYDALNRAFKTSNPFRPWQSQSAVWTTQVFDALGRVTSVTTPDNAAVTTSYNGNSATVTDQAGKARKSVSDALGRLIEAYEDPSGANLQTSYMYDVFDNLVKVTQGTQNRFFMYDSLKRLIRSRNPEQATNASLNLSDPLTGNSAWSTGYQYDANNNLTQKTDARNIVSTHAYDALNRTTTTDYSDTASINPDVKRFYDGAANGKGHFWYHYTGGDYATGSNVDHRSVDSYDALGRPLVQRQLFKLDGTWSGTYQTSRSYNAAGGVTSQTYPSGRVVNYNYDAAGRMADKDASNLAFTGNLGDGVQRTYSAGTTYSEWGSLSREKFGTQTALYHKLLYNIRGQLFDTRLSSVNDLWDWNRGRLIQYYSSNHVWGQSGTDNNGNVRFAETWIPPDNATLDQAHMLIEHVYSYDAFNRLSSVTEQKLEMPAWTWQQQAHQAYTYDRYGNRTINPASWGTGINTKQFTVDTATNRLGVPGGQSGVMSYDNAGNLTTDTYSGAGARTFDAENRMLTAGDFTGQISRYTYDADGKRTRRQVASSQQVWQIFGFDGELLAEYRATVPAVGPEKEYGYRNGQLLVTATGRLNVAAAANGAVATASSAHTCCGFSTTGAINGNFRGPWGNGEGWNDATENVVPDWIQVDFAGSKTIDEINVFSLHDNYTVENNPTLAQTFSLYGLLSFNVQYWNGSTWVTIPGGTVTGNNKVWRNFAFSPITTSKIRVFINTVPDAWSRVVEIQAFGTPAGGEKVRWLVPDHLGTPRMVADETGSWANIKRHDYLPFGEELFAGTGGRTAALGYAGDGVRQQFTQQERDFETGLDYFKARYYSPVQGRFISVDPSGKSINKANPQTWNRYSYTYNNPVTMVDQNGKWPTGTHDKIIATAFDKLSPGKVSEIQKGSAAVDRNWRQPVKLLTESTIMENQAHKHAMTPGSLVAAKGGNVQEAQKAANQEMYKFIDDKLKEAQKTFLAGENRNGPNNTSLFQFGEAMHPVMDNISPAHNWMQVYDLQPYLDIASSAPTPLLGPLYVEIAIGKFALDMKAHADIEARQPTQEEMNAMIDELRMRYLHTYGREAYEQAVSKEEREATAKRLRGRN
jgi:RHS repeat-associated protein